MILASMVCVLVLIWSGTAKLVSQQSVQSSLEGLALPQGRIVRMAAAAMPAVEIIIAFGWVLAPMPYAAVPAVLGLLLFFVFLIVVLRARGRRADAECMCFGVRRKVDASTAIRNLVLLLNATAAVIGGFLHAMGGDTSSILALILDTPAMDVAVGALVLIGVLLLLWAIERGSEDRHTDEPEEPVQGGGDVGVAMAPRSSPRVAFVGRDGKHISIDDVALPHGALILVLSESCHLCEIVRGRIERYRDMIAPVRLAVVTALLEDGQVAANSELGDLAMMASEALGATTYPSAVIALPNGTLPAGPVFGPDAIDVLVDELAAELSAARG